MITDDQERNSNSNNRMLTMAEAVRMSMLRMWFPGDRESSRGGRTTTQK